MLILTETDVDEGARPHREAADARRSASASSSTAMRPCRSRSRSASPAGPGPALRMDSLVRDADAAMYSAKSLGRNQTYVFAEPDDDARVPRAPISAAGRAHAIAIGKQAREAATLALTSVLEPAPPLPRPAVGAHRVDRGGARPTARAAGCRGGSDPDRRAAPRRRQDRRPAGHPRQAGGADRRPNGERSSSTRGSAR